MLKENFEFKDFFLNIKPPKGFTQILSLGLGLLLIWWLFSQIELASAGQIIREASVYKILLGFLCYGATFYLRAKRFRLLLPPQKKVHHLFPIVLVHYTALNIIPARLGELSYVYLLNQINGLSTGCSLSSLLLARVFDQIAVSTLFLFSLWVVDLTTPWLHTLSLIVGGLLVGLFLLLLLIFSYKERCFSWVKRLVERLTWNRYKIVCIIVRELGETIHALNEIDSLKTMGKVLGLSFLIWGCMFGVNYILLTAFGIPLSYIEIVLARTFIILLTMIPLEVFNNIGVRQTVWTFIVLAMGVPTKDVAVISAFGARIISLLYLGIFGLYGFWRLKNVSKNSEL